MVGHYSSDISLEASDTYHKCDLTMITPIASNPALTERSLPNVFRFTNRDDNTARAMAAYLWETLGKRRAAIFESQYAYGKSMTACFERAFARLGGEIVTRHEMQVGERDFTALAADIPSRADVVFYGGAFEGAYLLKALRRAGLKQLFAAGDGCWDVENFLQPANDAATEGEGVLILSASPSTEKTKATRDFARRYTERYGPVINYALNSYDSARMLIAVIQHAAEGKRAPPNRADVTRSMRLIQFRGIAYDRPIHWDARGDNTSAITALHVVDGGQFRQIAEIAQ